MQALKRRIPKNDNPIIYATGFLGKECLKCHEVKEMGEFHKSKTSISGTQNSCKECWRLNCRNRWKNGSKELAIKAIGKRYGLSESEYTAMLDSQLGLCAICGRPPGKRALHVDHDHETGKVRSMLCGACNVCIGMSGESVDRLKSIIAYLEKHNG
jgi:hypothetical protein